MGSVGSPKAINNPIPALFGVSERGSCCVGVITRRGLGSLAGNKVFELRHRSTLEWMVFIVCGGLKAVRKYTGGGSSFSFSMFQHQIGEDTLSVLLKATKPLGPI